MLEVKKYGNIICSIEGVYLLRGGTQDKRHSVNQSGKNQVVRRPVLLLLCVAGKIP